MHSPIPTTLLPLAALLATVSAHGRVTSPTPRTIGDAFKAACGAQVYSNQASDPNGNIQTMAQVGASQSDYDAAACELSLCKGYKYADSTANLETYSAGQTVAFTVDIVAPHTGTANVSVVDTTTNTVIGEPLVYWSSYASTATGVAANNTAFSVTIPESLTGCGTAGDCVLQWWWDARSIDQTYMSCVDFVLSGSSSSGSGSGSSSAAASGATSAATAASSKAASTKASTSAAATATKATTTSAANVAAASSSTATTLKTVVSSSGAAASSTSVSKCKKRKRTVQAQA